MIHTRIPVTPFAASTVRNLKSGVDGLTIGSGVEAVEIFVNP